MTDSATTITDRVRASQERFIELWGKMGSAWGIPRTMAEVHALLYVSGTPLNSEDVMERLGISRGNVSMTLRTLCEWGIVHRVHARGDRREYFRAELDVWSLFATIMRERKRREIDPMLAALEACRDLVRPDPDSTARRLDAETADVRAYEQRLDAMLELVRTLDRLSERFIRPGGVGLETAARLLAKVS